MFNAVLVMGNPSILDKSVRAVQIVGLKAVACLCYKRLMCGTEVSV